KISEDSIYINKMTAVWNKSSNISGYVLFYSAAGKEKKSVLLSADKTSYELTELEPGTSYTVSIQSYSTRRSVNYYSALSSVTASTEYRPTNAKEAVDSFVKAFNNTQNSKNNCSLFLVNKITPSFNNPHTVTAEKANAALSSQFSATAQYSFADGKEQTTGISLNSLMMSFASSLTLTDEDLDSEKVTFKNDGNGYRVGFVLENQTPSTDGGKLLAPKINTAAIEEATACEIKSVSYDKTQVSEMFTKIQGSLFDNFKTVSTVTVLINDGESDIPLTFDIERTYYFSWD
ncbi:MAG: fibronectin type III domain-containing protein, partial [Acutalibacteraceae bacterium]